MDRIINGLGVTLVGLLVVFTGLLVLVVLIKIMQTVFDKLKKPAPARHALPTELRELESRVRETLGVRATLSGTVKKGKIILQYYSQEELELYERQMGRKRVPFQVLDSEKLPDGMLSVRMKRRYVHYPVGDYLEEAQR